MPSDKEVILEEGRILLSRLLDAAEAHGKGSDPDHEVGDLQDILRDAWDRLTFEKQREVYELHLEKIDAWKPQSET